MIAVARKILLHDKLRFAITVSGVAFAVTLVCVQVGLFRGLVDNASVTIDHIDADLWVTSRNTANVDFSQTFPEGYVQRVRSVPGVERADNLIVWFMRLNLPNGATEGCVMYALEDFRRWNIPWNVMEGDVDDLRRGNYVFIDNSGVRRFGPFAVNDYREFMGRRLKIIGRAREAISFTTTPICFVNFYTAQMIDAQSLNGQTTYVLVKLAPGADSGAVQTEIRRRLPHNDVHTKAEWARLSEKYWVESTGIGLNMVITVFLGCVVGVVVVAQTLYTSTMEHNKEFATVKAIGGSNWHIYGILIEQAVVSAVAGFAIGAGLSLALQQVMPKVDLKLILSPDFFGIVLIGTVVFCVLASMVSFRKVSSMDPAMVFRG